MRRVFFSRIFLHLMETHTHTREWNIANGISRVSKVSSFREACRTIRGETINRRQVGQKFSEQINRKRVSFEFIYTFSINK